MTFTRLVFVFLSLLFLHFQSSGQRPEIALTLNEQFFDAAIDAMLSKGEPPFVELRNGVAENSECRETIRLAREMNGVRTAVRFRDGRIIVPIAFNGSYRFPLVGCTDFSGWADATIDVEFDAAGQRVLARAKVNSVSLNGTAGVGKNLIAPIVQSALDKRINPIELVRLDRLSFLVPIERSGNLRLRTTGLRHSVQNGSLTIFLNYELSRE